ncbi:hypothetical protein F0U44_10520 [Nocardioides humilatus]|uniref:Uncharacterized protein n=1 Tax=Nocardioides humilatus TaxID=2607660 RepID=A0A5B1LE37_9ACTN|nr:hypothetical protein [Nocardioides humilatus]KAA1418902.1 hypothetical protein F0U44_10520 [Nocardioides humilatus]
MPHPLRWLLLAVVLTALPITAGVLMFDEKAAPPVSKRPPPPAYASTALADYDSRMVALTRAPFCDRIADEAITEALGGQPRERTAYRNGQRALVTTGVDDIAHEYGCRITGARGELRAWLFAPPVTRDRARTLAAESTQRGSCTRPAGAPAYGVSSVALVCPAGNRTWVSFRGLFGDAWLSCSLQARTSLGVDALVDRAGRWCVAVAEAAAVSPIT